MWLEWFFSQDLYKSRDASHYDIRRRCIERGAAFWTTPSPIAAKMTGDAGVKCNACTNRPLFSYCED